ncbi:hypothetical protein ROJ8625_00888 [Roseivivax jejudonensis]|uniref:Uncharacterized protein n=1 Tax=Roseivivax jejudonensis TaxID=1529041 RepID=A0A1X6YIK7_9RHOB|nr:hypothetical protein [Roseivivax jejudonensis]SLN22676.1 hypothetical protein ROJ8625_00888 [Roseivivax jejudonensis]
MKIDLADIARGRRLAAVTARDLSLTPRHARPVRAPRWRSVLRRLARRLTG